jgi:hypothetical protein
MSSNSYNIYGNKGYEGIESLRQAARDEDRKQREEIRELLQSNPDITNKEFINSLKKARIMTGTVGWNDNKSKIHNIEDSDYDRKALTITPEEHRQARIDARNTPDSPMNDQEIDDYLKILENTITNRGEPRKRKGEFSGGKRRTRKSRKSRKSRKTRKSKKSRK